MTHDLENTIALLERTPAALDALLRGLPDEWTSRNEGENTWTVYDVAGHLIHGERTDWMPRVKRVLEFGESKAFDPFDRQAQMRRDRTNRWRHYWMNSPACEPGIWLNCGH